MQSRLNLRHALTLALAVGAGACSGSPIVTPPAVINTPPTVESLQMASPRAEADRPIQATAVVKDTESPLDKLSYTWSASPGNGTFGGVTTFSGNQVGNSWTPPKGQATPALYTIGLTVTESYMSAGQAKQNVVSTTTTVHYNDSPAEAIQLGYDFLVYKFGNYNISGAEAVSNFSDSCPGKAAEQEQIESNRQDFEILSANYPAPVASFNDELTAGSVEGPCTFEDKPKSGPNAGRREFVNGTCLLTVIYETANFRWRLCDSYFNPPYITEFASLRNRVPGRPFVR